MKMKIYDRKVKRKGKRATKQGQSAQRSEKVISIAWDIGEGEIRKTMPLEEYGGKMFSQFLNREILKVSGPSIFFPTFRRIEGGFFTSLKRQIRAKSFEEALMAMQRSRIYQELEEGIDNLSKELSVHHHKFVTSISTEDIAYLLTKRYADISGNTNKLQSELSNFVTDIRNSSRFFNRCHRICRY